MSDSSAFGEMQEIVDDFLLETSELLAILDEDLVALESSPDDLSLLEKIFRVVHTIKGTAGFLGFEDIVEVVHNTENILNKLRHGEMKLTVKVNDGILMAFDMVKKLTKNIKNNNTEKVDISEVLSFLQSILEGDTEGDSPAKPASARMKVSESEIPDLSESESAILEANEAVIKKEKPAAPAPPKEPEKKEKDAEKKEETTTVRVDVSRLDSVMNLVGELVLGRNRLLQTCATVDREFEDHPVSSQLNDITNFINLVISDLQLAVMKTRMQPVKKVFSKFPRMVRDLARSQHKDIVLEVSGEETELDKSVIESIGDPLVHLIRNSCDHGVETSEERVRNGKSPRGTIHLKAYYEGNNIIIEISDDGKGIDANRIKAKVLEKGLATPEELAGQTDKEIIKYIFKPGFSTAEKITDISGRGVGMDVVKTNISKLNGIIDITSEVGKGTKMLITLPLTVAIIQTLMVKVENEIFGIPLASVIQTLIVQENELKTIDQNEVINYRGSVLPIIRLSHIFNLESLLNERRDLLQSLFDEREKKYRDSKKDADDRNLYVIVIGLAEQRIGIIVDSVIGQEEIVLKSLGEYVEVKGLSGATIMGDGCVTLIIDIEELFEIAEETIIKTRETKERASEMEYSSVP